MVARNGDWLHAPFQCEFCWFTNIHKRAALEDKPSDLKELYLIRRVNLDVFWSRAKSTVGGYLGRIKTMSQEAAECGRPSPFNPMTPWESTDNQGMGIALLMLTHSLRKGRNAHYTQFDTCRQDRSIASNIYTATSVLSQEQNVLKTKRGEAWHLHSDPMQSMLMERFTKGMSRRMPEEVKRNVPLMGHTVAAMLKRMKREVMEEDVTTERRRELVMTGGYMCVTYGYSLRGNEGLWVCGDRLVEHIELGKEGDEFCGPHVKVPLIGFFKGEGGTRMHVLPIANETKTGIEVRWWLEEVVKQLKKESNEGCPAFCDEGGYQLNEKDLEKIFQETLEKLIDEGNGHKWWPRKVPVTEYCRCYRSFRRGAENTAINHDVAEETIELVNRWRKFEKSRGKQPGFKMLHHYASGTATRKKQLQFSENI